MATDTKNRAELKKFFVKNAIPTEGNFADLIDGQINQSDDGVFKQAGQPLAIVAATGNQQSVLQLYSSFPAANPDWLISLNPKPPRATSGGVAGFGIADGAGDTMLLLDAKGSLTVSGSVSYGGRLAKLDVDDNWGAYLATAALYIGHSTRRGTQGRAMVDGKTELLINEAKDWPLVTIDSPVQVSGTLTIRSPDMGIQSLTFTRIDEASRQHKWAFWHMNAEYSKNALEIWEYKADSLGKDCGGDPNDGAMCNRRLTIKEGGSLGIGKIPERMLDVFGSVRSDGEIQSTSANAFRMVFGEFGSFWRNDGNDTYLLLTKKGDQYGGWNDLRPFTVNNNTGTVRLSSVNVDGDAIVGFNLQVAGAVSISGGGLFLRSQGSPITELGLKILINSLGVGDGIFCVLSDAPAFYFRTKEGNQVKKCFMNTDETIQWPVL